MTTSTSQNKRAVTVGLFIIIGIVFLIVGILAIGNVKKTFTKTIMASAVFDDVEGLKIGNNVWFSGVKVGTVKKMDFIEKSQVKVTFRIEENASSHIRKDVKAKIGSEGLIGNKIIVLFDGTESAPVVEDGDVIVVEKTISTEDMMATFQTSNQNLQAITTDVKAITEQMRKGEGTLGKLLNDEALYESLNATLVSLRSASANAQQLTASLKQYGDKLDDPGTLANGLVTDTTMMPRLKATFVRLDEVSANASELTNNLKLATADPNTPMGVLLHDKDGAKNLKETFKNLETTTALLNEDLKAAQSSFLLRGYFKKKAKGKL